MLIDDAWYWTVNKLVAEICHSMSLFQAAGCGSENIPDAAALEDQLREQNVTGRIFLSALDSNALQYKLQIHHFGERMALKSVIDLLRQHSVTYKQHAATASVQALNLNNRQSLAQPDTPPISPADTAADGHKRRKITHITPALLPANPQQVQSGPVDTTPALVPQSQVDGSGEWDYLLRWQQADVEDEDEELTEEELDDDEGYVAEDAVEEDPQEVLEDFKGPEEVQGRSRLSSDQIVKIINERIEYFTNTWKPNKGAMRGDEINYDPELMWEEAEATGQRLLLVEKYEADVAYYRHRLDTLCDEILKAPGKNADIVGHQCRNLEVTIDSLELASWLLSIYALEPEYDDAEEEQLHNRSPSVELVRAKIQPQTQFIINRSRPPVEIIDLGSPPESSQSEHDGVIIGSSPPPGVHAEQGRSSSPDRFHTPVSVIADGVDLPVTTSLEFPIADRPAPLRSQVHLGDEPENASIASVRRWKWNELVETQDRKRIVSKTLLEMKEDDRETIRNRLKTVGKANMIREIPACISMLTRRENKMQGVLHRDMGKIITFTRLFLCWWLCDNYFRAEPSKWHLEELQQCLEEGSPDPGTFFDFLNKVMTTTFSSEALKYLDGPSQAEIIEISSDDDEPAPTSATQRKGGAQHIQDSQRHLPIMLD